MKKIFLLSCLFISYSAKAVTLRNISNQTSSIVYDIYLPIAKIT